MDVICDKDIYLKTVFKLAASVYVIYVWFIFTQS